MATLKKALIIFFVYYIFLITGAAIIMYIEERGLATQKSSVFNITDPLTRFLQNDLNVVVNASMLNKILEISQSVASKSKVIQNQAWKKDISLETFQRWRYFIQATLATEGYGDVVPETDHGKIFMIIYGLIGIPLNIAFVITIGALISKASTTIIRHTEQRILRQKKAEHVHLKTNILLAIFFISWLAIGASLHVHMVKCSWLEAFYSVFLQVSTINNREFQLTLKERNWYRELISWYMSIGLVLAAGAFYSFFKRIKMNEKADLKHGRKQLGGHEDVGKTNNGAEFE